MIWLMLVLKIIVVIFSMEFVRASPAVEQKQNYRSSLEKSLFQQWSNPSSKMISGEQLSSIFAQILLRTVHQQSWMNDENFHFALNNMTVG